MEGLLEAASDLLAAAETRQEEDLDRQGLLYHDPDEEWFPCALGRRSVPE